MSDAGMVLLQEPPTIADLRRQGIRLEAAASRLNGLAGRGDGADWPEAVEQWEHERAVFRNELGELLGVPADTIERWLAL